MQPPVITSELRQPCPNFRVGLIQARVHNSAHHPDLWEEIKAAITRLQADLSIPEINQHPVIRATRQAYKACGKEPNRYRPSAEALRRRVLQGKGLYQVSTLVDLVNLLSLSSGFSIGGFDIDKIHPPLRWGLGREGEPYEAIGRGALNIAGLPVLRDAQGGIGTPTSDNPRSCFALDTTRILLNLNDFEGQGDALAEAMDLAQALLAKYAEAADIEQRVVS